MLSIPLAAAVLAVLGGVAATTARDRRIAILGLMLAAVASSLVASPLPSSLALTARVLGTLLGAYLLWRALGAQGDGRAGSTIGPIAEAAAATAAFVAGLAIQPVDPLGGPLEAQAAGLALIVLSLVPLAGKDLMRIGIGVILLAVGGGLLANAWAGTLPDLEQLAVAALLVGIAGATALLVPSLETEPEALDAAAFETVFATAPRAAAKTSPASPAPTSPSRAPRPAWPAQPPAPSRPTPIAPAAPRPPATSAARPAAPPAPPRPARDESETAARPMTADPLDFEGWLAWSAPEPEPESRRRKSHASAPEPNDSPADEDAR